MKRPSRSLIQKDRIVLRERRPIVIVDDDPDFREAVSDTLVDEGYRAVALADGLSALEYLRREPPPALILLDWNMTPLNGLQFMAEFAKDPRWAAIPVALLTADAKADEKVKLASFVGYLRKPTQLENLLELVQRYCSA